MSKVHKVVDPRQSVAPTTHHSSTDWSRCVLCQENTTEMLHCPADSKRGTAGAGYTTIADNISGFIHLGCLPKTVNVSYLCEDETIELTFKRHEAKFHDSCRLRLNKTELRRAGKRKSTADYDTCLPSKYTRQTVDQAPVAPVTCFFCDLPACRESLRHASTKDITEHVKICATKLQDSHILAKLSVRDMVAQDAKYHAKCLVSFYNRIREKKTNNTADSDSINKELAFAETLSYIEDSSVGNTVAPVFKMTDLSSLYRDKLNELGTVNDGRINTTHLKNRLLESMPDMTAIKKGREVMLIGKDDVGSAVEKAYEQDANSETVHLANAANIVRRDIVKLKNKFDGSFDSMCQEGSVPNTLVTLVSMILTGPDSNTQSNDMTVTQSALTMSQLLVFNSSVRRREKTRSIGKHNPERETPLPVYLGVMIHTKTRKRELVDIMFNLGLSICYDRVLSISTDLANTVCNFYESQKVVCPPQLKGGLFTTAAVDNIDHNPSNTTSHDSFHGTGISLFQQPSNEISGVTRTVNPRSDQTHAKTVAHLPESYASVAPVPQCRHDPPMPKVEGPNKADGKLVPQAMTTEYRYIII